MRDWTRRSVVKTLGAGTAATLFSSCASLAPNSEYFRHGVASGDPLQHRVIIWTRITTPVAIAGAVHWEVAQDPQFSSIVASGNAMAGKESDFTVKVDVIGLAPGNIYYYRFNHAGDFSPTGRTRTLPAGDVDSISVAVLSCSNYPAGYFNVYDAVSRLEIIDVVVHLGDYIYEYGSDGYGTEHAEELGRVPNPQHEVTTLDDYRARYAQYRMDGDLQAMHQRHPMIAVWDDHEFANNAWMDGAQNHNAEEGDWTARKHAAQKAFREWLPIRDTDESERIYRSFEFGDLATLLMLDTRIAGRDREPMMDPDIVRDKNVSSEQLDEFRRKVLNVPARDLLGKKQSRWLRQTLRNSAKSQKTWQMIGQQIVMGDAIAPDLNGIINEDALANTSPGIRRILAGVARLGELELPINLDAWDGYPAARERLYADFQQCANNTVVFSGDSHSASASNLINRAGQQVGVEFAATSITSPGLGYYLPDASSADIQQRYLARNAKMRYINANDNGFCICRLDRQVARNDWYVVNTTTSHRYSVSLDNTMEVESSDAPGTRSLQASTT